MKEIVVIGGGASGYAAACAALENAPDAVVTLLEGASRTGRKILASGNGRCNLLNDGENVYFGDAAFADRVLMNCTREDVRAFFARAGLQLAPESEEDGRVYPATGQAASVMDALRAYAARLGVKTVCDTPVTDIGYGKKGFTVNCREGRFRADRVIVCCGSPAGGKLGVDSYHLLTDLGHKLIAPVPALTPILCDMTGLASLKGLRVPVKLTLTRKGVPLESTEGEALFSEHGVSGVCAMQLGRAAKKGDQLHLDFAPLLALEKRTHSHTMAPDLPGGSYDKVLKLINDRAAVMPREDLFTGLLPRVLADVVQKRAKNVPAQARLLSDFVLDVTGVRGLDQAQVAHGGIDTCEFDPDTMESRFHPGVYAAGEVLNVDGECGGFNLLFAWAGGLIAGSRAGRSL